MSAQCFHRGILLGHFTLGQYDMAMPVTRPTQHRNAPAHLLQLVLALRLTLAVARPRNQMMARQIGTHATT